MQPLGHHAILFTLRVGRPDADLRKNPMTRLLVAPSLALALLVAAPNAQNEIRPGPWPTAAKVPAGWVTHNTKNYHVQSNAGVEKAKRLGDHMEVMNACYRRMFKPDKDGTKAQTIKLFKDHESYLQYAARAGVGAGAAAYYAYDDREMVCYDTGKWMDEQKAGGPTTGPETARDRLARRMSNFEDMMTMDLLGTAAHEGWHQYYHWLVVSRVELPSWINEGMGDYFYTAAPKDGKGKKADIGRINDGRLWVLQTAKRQDRMEPLEKFIGMLQRDYYSNPSICYAQGWAFCQFLLHGEKGKYAKVIPNYVRFLCSDTNWQVVQGKAFKGFDLAVMEQEFKAYIDTMKPSVADPFGEEAVDEPVATPPAPPPGEPPAPTPPAPTPEPTPTPPAPNEPPRER